jgi:radical SAM superfamily enzyme YgiQ (UPF0313 family)
MLSTCRWRESNLVISTKPGCITISIEYNSDTKVFSFDLAGRLWTALEGNVSFRRGLDGKILARWKDSSGAQNRKWLSNQDALDFEKRARELAATIFSEIGENKINLDPQLDDRSLLRLKKVAEFGEEPAQHDRMNFARIYRPIGILPPDQYMSVVLQATEGCSFNSCTFCSFYRDQLFRIKSPEEFYHHAFEVREFLGEGISLRKTIFLGGANALVLPMDKIKPILEIIHQVFDVNALGGIYAFSDGFSGEKKSVADYIQLAEMGIKTIYIGLESGCEDLLQFLNKPGTANGVLNTVFAAKSAGIAVAIIILLGAGGRTFAEKHIDETIAVINQMKLDAGDMIYFSKMIVPEDVPYSQDAHQAKLIPLTESEQEDQWQKIEQRLVFDDDLGTPHISIYDIRDFIF